MNEGYESIHHYEGAEIYLNGQLLGHGNAEAGIRIEEEMAHNSGWDDFNLLPSRRKVEVKLQLHKVDGWEQKGDWVIRHEMNDGSTDETKFSNESSAREALRLLRTVEAEGNYELVFIPEIKEQVMDTYENTSEEEERPLRGPDPLKVYKNSKGGVFKYYWPKWRLYPSLKDIEEGHPGQVCEDRHVLLDCHDWSEVK